MNQPLAACPRAVTEILTAHRPVGDGSAKFAVRMTMIASSATSAVAAWSRWLAVVKAAAGLTPARLSRIRACRHLQLQAAVEDLASLSPRCPSSKRRCRRPHHSMSGPGAGLNGAMPC